MTAPFETIVEVMPHDECIRLLKSEEVGRIAWSTPSEAPHLLPLNFAWDGNAVVFRTDSGSSLCTTDGIDVAFEIDKFDRVSGQGWSIVLAGRAFEVQPEDWPAGVLQPDTLYLESWIPGSKPRWIRIVPNKISGRRIERSQSPL